MKFFSRLHFRNRLLLTFLFVLIPLILLGSTIAYYQVEKILKTGIESTMNSRSMSLLNLITTSAKVSVRNRLHAIAEKNLDIAAYYYKKYQSGLLERDQAVKAIEEIFSSQTIGQSGYIYCLNSKGIVTVHPNAAVKNSDVSRFGFVQRQMVMKTGYLEYDWKNPGELKARPKALYMVYFEPLDWIISVSGYRNEFYHFVDLADFRENILEHKAGETGYAWVVNEQGLVLVHPKLQNVNLLDRKEYPRAFVTQMLNQKNGKARFFLKLPGEKKAREKTVIYRHLPEYHWIVVCSNYVEEVYAPLAAFRMFIIVLLVLFILFSAGALFMISRAVTRPLETFIKKLDQGEKGDFSVRMEEDSQDEFGRLAVHFNSFMAQLEQNQAVIDDQNKKNIETRNALVENELKLRSLFDQSFQYTCILSPAGILEEMNQSSLDFAGFNAGEVLYTPFWELPWWHHDPEVRGKVKQAVKNAGQGEFSRLETTLRSKKDEVRYIDLSVKPIFNSSGEVAFIITEGRDITEYKLASKERKSLAVQMEKAQKMESIGTLAGGIAHDFNNILSGILGYAQLAELNISQPMKAKGHIAQILKGARRAARLTQQILTFSRQHDYEKTAIEPRLILKEALKLLRSSIPVTISIEEDIRSKARVFADPTQIHQVIMNLCTNAYHAMGETGGVLTVNLREKQIFQHIDCFGQTMKNGNYLELEIIDTGIGMDEEVMVKAFDPYFTTKEVGKGTGFGLALVHAIIDAHDGYIKVKSRPGEGSAFQIYLPIINQSGDELPMEIEPVRIDRGTERIMVVDDEEDIRVIVKEYLSFCGYTADVFKNGLEALAAFERDPDYYDLILSDLTMPEMTGDELSRKVLNIRKDMPIILCTGYSETVSEAQALEIGVSRYVHKPLTNEELASVVRDVLDNTKMPKNDDK